MRIETALCGVILMAAAASAADNIVAPGQVTFTKDVAPILQRACQNCHRPNNIAPMSLLTYQEARPWARSIKENVLKRNMPPWFIDRNVGIRQFKNDPSLTNKEIATIAAWVDGGAPEGSRADMPPPRQFEDADQWHIGKPDLIVSMPVAFTVKPESSDWWGYFTADSGLTEDRYIKAIETRPSPGGGIKVVHHAVTSLIDDDGVSEGGTLNEYAVGKNGDIYPEGSGKLMKAGVRIRFNMHYHAIGRQIVDQTTVGLVFYPKGYVPKHVMNTVIAQTQDIDIPAGAENVRTDAYYKMEKPARLTGYQPHMHNRGKAQCMEAIYPNMTVEQLSCVNRYNFGWQIVYNYADDVTPLLPAGTIIHLISWHDNSTKNPWNPDPRNWVGYGERTSDDMSRAWLNYYYLSDEEFKAEAAKRAALTATVARSGAQIKYAAGQNVVPVYEGWERNADGTFKMVFGYMNRNYEEEVDVPIGPNNTIEPGGADRGQPAHFYPRRQEFAFEVKVPKDWGDKDLVWTLTSAGKTEKAYGTLKPIWEIGNLVYQENRGGPGELTYPEEPNSAPSIEMVGSAQRTIAVGEALTLSVDVMDDGHPTPRTRQPRTYRPRGQSPITQAVVKLDPGVRLGVTWVVYRGGPGTVTFEPMRVPVVSVASGPLSGRATTKATFSEPGSYVLRAYADDGVRLTPLDATVTVTAGR